MLAGSCDISERELYSRVKENTLQTNGVGRSGLRTFDQACHICHKSFKYNRALKAHLLTHGIDPSSSDTNTATVSPREALRAFATSQRNHVQDSALGTFEEKNEDKIENAVDFGDLANSYFDDLQETDVKRNFIDNNSPKDDIVVQPHRLRTSEKSRSKKLSRNQSRKKLKCSECVKKFKNLGALKSHLKSHYCKICGLSFKEVGEAKIYQNFILA